MPCSGKPDSVGVDFWSDAPWLEVPPDRLARIIEHAPLHQGGLLGGSMTGAKAPKSKLAALAAARKKEKEDLRKDSPASSPFSILDRLQKPSNDLTAPGITPLDGASDMRTTSSAPIQVPRKYPIRKRKQSLSPQRDPKVPPVEAVKNPSQADAMISRSMTISKASPSAFARTLFRSGSLSSPRTSSLLHTRYVRANAEIPADIEGFAGPSPDDKVLRAQKSSKGLK